MILALRAALIFGLIWALTSFGFTAGVLVTLLGQPSYINSGQLYEVTGVSAVAAIVALTLIVLLALKLLGKRNLLNRFLSRALHAIGIVFCGMAMYSFLTIPGDQQIDFFSRFAHGARFEFLLIGVTGLIMSSICKD